MQLSWKCVAAGQLRAEHQGDVYQINKVGESWVLLKNGTARNHGKSHCLLADELEEHLEATSRKAMGFGLERVKQEARKVIQIQDAPNLSGVLRSYGEALGVLRQERPELGSTALATHPISQLYAAKLVQLAGFSEVDIEPYAAALHACKEIAES